MTHAATSRKSSARPLALAALAFAAALCLLSASRPAAAQTCVSCEDPDPTPTPRATPRPPTPTPTPSATPRPSSTPDPTATPGPTPAPGEVPGSAIVNTLATIAVESQKALAEASQLVRLILADIIWYLAGTLATIMTVLAFARLLSEDNGSPVQMLRLFFRAVVCIIAFSHVTPIMTGFEDTKQDILDKFQVFPAPPDASGTSHLVTPTQLARIKFELTYKKFTNAYYKDLQPKQDPSKANDANGILGDPNKPWQTNVDRLADPNGWSAPRLFGAMTIFRGLFSFMDLGIEIIYGATKLGILLLAPVMFSVAIDKQTFNQITLPFIKGLVVFYIVWPVVADVIRLLCYMFSTITVEAFLTPVIQRTEGQTALGNPVIQIRYISDFNGYAVTAACFLMFVCTIALFRSPWIAHRIASGQVFEAISSSIASGITTVTGVALEQLGANASSQIEQMARMSEIEGQQQSAVIGASARQRAGDLGVESQLINAKTQNLTQYRSTSSGLNAENQRANQMLMAENQRTRETGFASANANANRVAVSAEMSKATAGVQRDQAVGQANINQSIEGQRNYNNWSIDTAASPVQGIPVASGIVGVMANPAKGKLNDRLITSQGNLSRKLADNVENAQTSFIQQNANANIAITQTEYGKSIEAADHYTQSGGAANAAYNQTMQGVARQNYSELDHTAGRVSGLGHQANAVSFQGEIDAAGAVFSASKQAAQFHRVAAQISAATRDLDRTMQEGLALNY